MWNLKIKFCFFLFYLTVFVYSQGDDNLLMQYNQGPDLDAFYRKWNFDLHSQLVYGSMSSNNSIPKISFSFGSVFQFKFSKTFGISSGVELFNLNYQYNLNSNQSIDKISYLTIPLTIRVFPSRKLIFETGMIYNYFVKAKNSEIVDLKKQSQIYIDGIFKNTFGWLFKTQYNVWKRLDFSIQYRFFRKNTPNNKIQNNDFKVFLFGIHYFIFNPKKKPN